MTRSRRASSSCFGRLPARAPAGAGEIDPFEDQRELGSLDRARRQAPIARERRVEPSTLETLVPHPELQTLRSQERALCA